MCAPPTDLLVSAVAGAVLMGEHRRAWLIDGRSSSSSLTCDPWGWAAVADGRCVDRDRFGVVISSSTSSSFVDGGLNNFLDSDRFTLVVVPAGDIEEGGVGIGDAALVEIEAGTSPFLSKEATASINAASGVDLSARMRSHAFSNSCIWPINWAQQNSTAKNYLVRLGARN